MTTVTWTQDANSNYEVSSPEHLKQIMNRGALYTDAGTPPTSYWGSGINYIQTADIDLLGDSTDIKPIGVADEQFLGIYDGGEFKISNWSYVDPEFTGTGTPEGRVGLFGSATGTLKNLRLTGLWKLEGYSGYAGFLLGFMHNTTTGFISNVVCDFSEGSLIDTNSFSVYVGGIGGYVRYKSISGIVLNGSVNFGPNTNSTTYKGGLFGYMYANGNTMFLHNNATFPSGIDGGNEVGGVCGRYNGTNTAPVVSTFVNTMTGDVVGTKYVGGVAGNFFLTLTTGVTCEKMVNSMTGNIICDGTSSYRAVGGVFGYAVSQVAMTLLFNYMDGDISGGVYTGGLIGLTVTTSAASLEDSINAMNGTVDKALIGDSKDYNSSTYGFPFTKVNVSKMTTFGLTFSGDLHGTTTSFPTGLRAPLYFSGLPYVLLNGTDDFGNSHEIDFVYANLSGSSSSSFNAYTHCTLHKGDVTTPFDINFDVSETNTFLYTTFTNATTGTINQPNNLTIIVPPPLIVVPRPVNIPVVITKVSGAIGYNVTIEGPTGGETTALSGVTTLEHNITDVIPDTTYTLRLYADTGTGYNLTETLSTTTPSNVAANYDITDFQDNGVIDLTSLNATTLSSMSSLLTELVNTGDVVSVSLPSNPELATSFVNAGENLSIVGDAVLLPFDTTSGAGQSVTLTLPDNTTTVDVGYDEGSNTIIVESTSYSSGDTFVLDGRKIEIFDYYDLNILTIGEKFPLAVEPRSINIPVVVVEVPGATGYNITYEGPTGGEITAFSGVTTLQHNITGLDPETQYTIKLYADTGSGYVLTEELTTTTLPNVAANYDVNIFVEDGVINLSSLPENTISNIGEVMNELFDTGDIVNVSVQGKPDLNTSFINIGDELSISNIDGVLLPFVQASTPGQDVSVRLSDDSTVVGINFDEVVNTITVNGVTYSPGDSFILDGKKVTVVEY